MPTLHEALDSLHPIVDTTIASSLVRDPGGVAQRYAQAGANYYPSDRIASWSGRIVQEIVAGGPVTGYVVGDFGYGKTSTALHLVRECEAAGIVVVPPVVYTSIDEMAASLHAFVRHAVGTHRPSLAVAVDDDYARVRAPVDAQAFINFARSCGERVLESGQKGLVFVIDELQEYLNVGDSARTRAQALSYMVKAVRELAPTIVGGRTTARGLPFGVVMLMPASPTEGMLREQADDMMQRMEEHGTSLRLDDAYGVQFVRGVWGRVCGALDDPGLGRRLVHDQTLVALGQLVARRDLSNGPRTMMQAFRRIIQNADAGGGIYTPVTLATDYLDGHLVFEGAGHRVTGTMTSLLRRPEVEASPLFQRTAMLMAVYPDGLSEEAADAIDEAAPLKGDGQSPRSTYQAILDLNEAPHLWLGTETYQVRSGAYALVSLQADQRPPDVMSTLIREFSVWYRNLDESRRAEYAFGSFLESVVPALFEVRRAGADVGFKYAVDGGAGWDRDDRGVAFRVLQGAPGQLFQRYPDRRLCLAIGTDRDAVRAFGPPAGVSCHLVWRITLVPSTETTDGSDGMVVIESARADRCVDLQLPMGRALGAELPAELDVLRNRVSPERTCAQVLLALTYYAGESLRRNPAMSVADRQQHEQLVRDLVREIAKLLVPEVNDPARVRVIGVVAGGGATALAGAEKHLVESLFRLKCAEVFPDYRPLAGYGQWQSNLSKYTVALRQCTLAQRRGQEPVARDEKSQLAGLFGLANLGYDNLLRYCKERGLLGQDSRDTPSPVKGREPSSSLTFTESPLEALVRDTLGSRGRLVPVATGSHTRNLRTLEVSVIREAAAKSGYLAEEVDAAVELLKDRQYVRALTDGTVQQHPGDVTANDLRVKQTTLVKRVDALGPVLTPESAETLRRQVALAAQRLEGEPDEIALDSAERELDAAIRTLGEAMSKARSDAEPRLRDARLKVRTLREGLRLTECDNAVVGSVNFVGAVEDTRRRLGNLVRACDATLSGFDAECLRLAGLDVRADDEWTALASGVKLVISKVEALTAEAKRLGGLVETLPHWRNIVAVAGTLVPDPQTEAWKQFDREISTEVLRHLAARDPQSLGGYEHFKALLEGRRLERQREQDATRHAFDAVRDAYERRLQPVIDQYKLRTMVALDDVDGSYRLLRAEVVEKIAPWIAQVDAEASRLLDDLGFLKTERGIDVAQWLQGLEDARGVLAAAARELSQASASPEGLEALTDRLRTVRDGTIGPARSEYARLRVQTEPADALEQRLLNLLGSVPGQRPQEPVSIEAVRRTGVSDLGLEDLLSIVGKLYRKGHLDIQVRVRQP
jgi:RecA/RadA recombinase